MMAGSGRCSGTTRSYHLPPRRHRCRRRRRDRPRLHREHQGMRHRSRWAIRTQGWA